MKICNICKENKELSAFSSSPSTKDKLCPKCKDCVKEYNKQYRAANKERLDVEAAEYRAANIEATRVRSAKWREENREHVQQLNKDFYARTKEQFNAACNARYRKNSDRVKQKSKEWRENNPDKVQAQLARRRAKKLQAVVSWADNEAIGEIYKQCQQLTKETDIPHQVDHIIPLNSDLVCGLHVESNLQILTAEENNKKKNKFDPETFEA